MGFALLRAGLVAATVALPVAAPAFGQTKSSPPNPSAPSATETGPAQPGDAFGEDAALTAKTIVYVKGSGTLGQSLRNHHRLVQEGQKLSRQGRHQARRPADDDLHRDRRYGFRISGRGADLRRAEKSAAGDLALGRSPEGKALKFVHRGSYDDLDNTYEAITNYLDDKRLEAKDMFIEEYVTDPTTTDAKKLVVNVYVVLKPGQASPG